MISNRGINMNVINTLLQTNNLQAIQALIIAHQFSNDAILKILNTIIAKREKLLISMIKFLSTINFSFNTRFENQDTILIRIVKTTRNERALIALINAGANIHDLDMLGNNAIDYAILLSKYHFVKILLENKCRPGDFDFSFKSCLNKKTPSQENLLIINLLIKKSEKNIGEFQDYLRLAVSCQNQDIVKLLLMMNVPVYESMLEEIIKTNNVEFAKNIIGFFIKKYPEKIPSEFVPKTIPEGVNQQMFAFCYYALQMIPDGFSSVYVFQIPAAVKYIFDNDIKTGREKFNDANMIALQIHPESLAMLIAAGLIDNEKRNRLGSTLLHIATYFMKLDTIKLLIFSGANLDASDNRNQTPLDIAMEGVTRSGDNNTYMFCAKILLQAGAKSENKATQTAIRKYIKPEERKRKSIYANGVPSLFCIATQQIMTNTLYKKEIKNLSYRNNMPLNEDCVKQFEEQALKIMTPK